MRRALMGLLALCLLAPAARAGEIDWLQTDLQEGGYAIGRIAPGGAVEFAGRAAPVAPDGRFVIGFHRDSPARVVVRATGPDGARMEQTLSLAQRDYDIQRIDGLPENKVTPPEETLQRIRDEAAAVRAARERGSLEIGFDSGWIWPVRGRITGVFGAQRILNGHPRQPHYGVDIAAPTGTPVVAPADGVVSFAHPDLYYSGATLMIDHGLGLASTFLHLDDIAVREGEKVRQGRTIGRVGSSGRSTGPHLDWRINWFDARLDAALFVPPMPATGGGD
ncbi:MAG: M23 family metallopeptidase [Marivibrio sp.]|uniref:M23 family metallopeptidase n=1 Tax=Marivibrio sp. TaxID=2039719 RepID=UPI0032EBF84C